MDNHFFSLQTARLTLGGALLGVALLGLIAAKLGLPRVDMLGALLGGASVLMAKYRHVI